MELSFDNVNITANPRWDFIESNQGASCDLSWFETCSIMGFKSKYFFDTNGLIIKEECRAPTPNGGENLCRKLEYEYDNCGKLLKKTILDTSLANEPDFKTGVIVTYLSENKVNLVVKNLKTDEIVTDKVCLYERKCGQFDKRIHEYYNGIRDCYYYMFMH